MAPSPLRSSVGRSPALNAAIPRSDDLTRTPIRPAGQGAMPGSREPVSTGAIDHLPVVMTPIELPLEEARYV